MVGPNSDVNQGSLLPICQNMMLYNSNVDLVNIMCIQNLMKFYTFILKIWSKNQILESIKGRNSVANLRKTTINNTNIDLVNDDVHTKFGLILSISSQDIE